MKAVITGASSGIGREIAIKLSAAGYETVLVARRADRLMILSEKLEHSTPFVCDLTDPGECERLFSSHPDAEVLVNCAGCGVFGEFLKTELERELDMLALNVVALHTLTKLYARAFAARGRGRILNVASSAGFFSSPLFSSYYASKSYVVRLGEALSHELKGTGVTVSTFCPGPVATEFGDRDGIGDGRGALSAERAADVAVRGMEKGKGIFFPNLSTRALVFFSRFIPRAILLKIIEKEQIKKAGKGSRPLAKTDKM